jgi:hypothetical protein
MIRQKERDARHSPGRNRLLPILHGQEFESLKPHLQVLHVKDGELMESLRAVCEAQNVRAVYA